MQRLQEQIHALEEQIHADEGRIASHKAMRTAAAQARERRVASETQRVVELQAQQTAELSALARQKDELQQALRDAQCAFADTIDSFARRGAAALSTDEVAVLLKHLHIDVAPDVLSSNGIDGSVLAELTEGEMADVLGIAKFCDRRRLTLAVQRLKAHQPLALGKEVGKELGKEAGAADETPTHKWGWEEAARWAEDQEVPDLPHLIRKHRLPGEVLQELSRDDLRTHLGLTDLKTLGVVAKAIARLRVERGGGANTAAGAAAVE